MKFMKFPISIYKINIFDRERTICDVLKYESKLDKNI